MKGLATIFLALSATLLAIPPRSALTPLTLDTPFYGATVPSGYAAQPLLDQVAAGDASLRGATGAGTVVALIDNGVDPFNPALSAVLLGAQGWNFYDNSSNWSAWSDLSPHPDALGSALAQLEKPGSQCPVWSKKSPLADLTLNGAALPLDTDADEAGQLLALMHKIVHCEPTFGHGTAVAGLIHLIAPQAKILPLKAFGPFGMASAKAVASAIRYAIAHHANVINLSFTSIKRDPAIQAAVAAALARGIVVVAAGGNANSDAPYYPASLPGVLSVGSVDGCAAVAAWLPCALDPPLLRAGFSNYDPPAGILNADIAAPGVRLLTTFPGFGVIWASSTGTSFSAAIVSGEAALLAGLGRTRGQIANAIEGTADPAIPGDADG
ncbi:MAG: S8 family peptidase, partial [Terriglobales bacterium]